MNKELQDIVNSHNNIVILSGAGQVVVCCNAVKGFIVVAAFYAGGVSLGLAAVVGVSSITLTVDARSSCEGDERAG